MPKKTKNLQFKCVGCGECCRRPGEVRFDDETFEAIATFLHLGLEEFRRMYRLIFDPEDKEHWVLDVVGAEPCPFLIQDQCSIHAVRPRQCRTYPFWPEILRSSKTWNAEMLECPGIGIGPTFNEVDVLSLMNAEKNQLPVSQLLKLNKVSDD